MKQKVISFLLLGMLLAAGPGISAPVLAADNAAEPYQTLHITLESNYTYSGDNETYDIPVHVVQKIGSDEDNMVIVIAAEGYTLSEQDQFLRDAKTLWDRLLTKEPYRSYASKMNVYALCTPSEVSWDNRGGGHTFWGGTVWQNTSLTLSGNALKNQVFTRYVGPAFISQVHDAHVKKDLSPNVVKFDASGKRENEFSPYYYVYDYVSEFVLLVNSTAYLGGAGHKYDYGMSVTMCSARNPYYSASYTFPHEMGHGLLGLGDEYNTAMTKDDEPVSKNMSYTGDPTLVKWREMLGFRNTFSTPYSYGATSWNSSNGCIMSSDASSSFCEVCKLQGVKRMSSRVRGDEGLYVAVPEVTLDTGKYSALSDFADATKIGAADFNADHASRLLSGAYQSRFDPNTMKGRTVELRTIIQNLSGTRDKTVKMELWVEHAGGQKARADGKVLQISQEFTIRAWEDRANYDIQGVNVYAGSDFNSGLKSCSLKYTIPATAELLDGDVIRFRVLDTTDDPNGVLLADDGTELRSYGDVRITYKTTDGAVIPNTMTTAIPMPVGTTINWAAPAAVQGYAYAGDADGLGQMVTENGLDITYYYENHPVEAAARAGHDITVQTEGKGKAFPSVRTASQGDEVRLNVAADEGWKLLSLDAVTGAAEIANNRFIMPDSPVTLQAVFVPDDGSPTLGGTISIPAQAKFGQTLTVDTSKLTGAVGALTYTWQCDGRTVGSNSAAYTPAAADIGKTITAVVSSAGVSGSVVSGGARVEKADGPAAPAGLRGIAPTAAGKADGKITGAAATMEYSSSKDFSAAASAAGAEIAGLSAGTYYVRVKETPTHQAGASATVTIPEGETPLRQIPIPQGDETEFVYDGRAKTYQIPSSPDYTVRGNVQTAANENGYLVRVTLKDTTHTTWADGTTDAKEYSFVIRRATPTGTPRYTEIKADGRTLADAKLTTVGADFSVAGSVGWTTADGMEALGQDTRVLPNTAYRWEFTPDDLANYRPIAGEITLYTAPEPTKPPEPTPSPEPTNPPEPTRPPELRFVDVAETDFFYDAVYWAVRERITLGVGGNRFAPDDACTRADMVTFLWRSAGSPDPVGGGADFTDVSPDKYYYKPILWAREKGITKGISDTEFGPELIVNRAQTATFLHRAVGAEPSGSRATFSDVADTEYYAEAVSWAAERGITLGIGGGLFGPDEDCTRGQIVTMLFRAAQP